MKRIYILNGIFNIILGIISYIPFIAGLIFLSYGIGTTQKILGIGIYIIWIILAVFLNYITYLILKKYSKKIEYVIRKKLYFLISATMFFLMLLLTTYFMFFV